MVGSLLYFYNPLLFSLNFDQDLGGILWLLCLVMLGMLLPRLGKDFFNRLLNVLLEDKTLLSSQNLWPACNMVWEMVPSCCFFPHLELHSCNHWSYRIIYSSVVSSHLIIINFTRALATHLVMQETIIFFNRRNTSNAASGINKVISKYLSEELPLGVTQYLPRFSDQSIL